MPLWVYFSLIVVPCGSVGGWQRKGVPLAVQGPRLLSQCLPGPEFTTRFAAPS